MIIDNAGTYTLRYTATDDCGKTTTVDRELVVEAPEIYGVEWDGSSSPVWTRTDKSVDFVNPVAQYSDGNGGWIGGSSPFDNIMPWSGMQIVEDATVGTLVSIPKFYYKWTRFGTDNVGMKLQISNKPQEGFLTSPAHADRGDGVGERDIVYVGRYHCSSGWLSRTNTQAAAPTIVQARSEIHALGTDIWQFDFAMYWTICMLYLVEFANWDSQSMIGMGNGYNTQYADITGSTDNMTYHTGTDAISLSDLGSVQYRHVEGLWSGNFDFIDGIYFDTNNYYAVNNPAYFGDNTKGVLVGQSASTTGVGTSFTVSSVAGYEYAILPSATGPLQFTTGTCDMFGGNSSSSTGERVANFGGYRSGSSADTNYGLFRIDSRSRPTTSSWYTGSRLMKLPNA